MGHHSSTRSDRQYSPQNNKPADVRRVVNEPQRNKRSADVLNSTSRFFCAREADPVFPGVALRLSRSSARHASLNAGPLGARVRRQLVPAATAAAAGAPPPTPTPTPAVSQAAGPSVQVPPRLGFRASTNRQRAGAESNTVHGGLAATASGKAERCDACFLSKRLWFN
ncbi:hypothetical protein CRUP_027438 [Coryphaenoides rupestris]|nr:hypothetical protein CRUP_027438 [Coryphaenoides rupestris]